LVSTQHNNEKYDVENSTLKYCVKPGVNYPEESSAELLVDAHQAGVLAEFEAHPVSKGTTLAEVFVAGAKALMAADPVEPTLTREERNEADAVMARNLSRSRVWTISGRAGRSSIRTPSPAQLVGHS
jgi:hypothetical protein